MSEVAAQEQLVRYAHDLHDLLVRHEGLQQSYQLLVRSLGCGALSQERLADALLQASQLHLITNLQGEIQYISPDLNKICNVRNHKLAGQPIQTLMAPLKRPATDALLAQLAADDNLDASVQCKLSLRDDRAAINSRNSRIVYDALVAVRAKNDHARVYWLLKPEDDPKLAAIEVQQSFGFFQDAQDRLLLADHDGLIRAVNPAFSRGTGFAEADLKGLELSSIDHKVLRELDHNLWFRTDEVLSRRKNGRPYLAWQTVKTVRNADGEILSCIANIVELAQGQDDSAEPGSLAHFDPLTGLPNRQQLEDILKRMLSTSPNNKLPLVLLFLEISYWKPLDDQAMLELGNRLKSSVRDSDLIARIGNNEFVVVLQNDDIDIYVEMIVHRIQQMLSRPIEIDHKELLVEVSVGCARYRNQGEDIDTLLRRARAAMHQARQLESHFCHDGNDDADI